MSLVIAIGYRTMNAVPKVLYLGSDVDSAKEAVRVAGEKSQIIEGIVVKDFTGNYLHRSRFSPTPPKVLSGS
jgi:hypothetical protein